MIRQVPHLPDHLVCDCCRVSTLWQVQQDHEPSGSFHESPDLACPVLADDEVAFPMPRYRSVFNLHGTFRDHYHSWNLPCPCSGLLSASPLPGYPLPSPPTQTGRKLFPELTFALHVDGSVDRLVGDVHRW